MGKNSEFDPGVAPACAQPVLLSSPRAEAHECSSRNLCTAQGRDGLGTSMNGGGTPTAISPSSSDSGSLPEEDASSAYRNKKRERVSKMKGQLTNESRQFE